MENEEKIPVNLPKTDIVISENATIMADSGKEKPVVLPETPIANATDAGIADPPDIQEITKQIRGLTNKAVLIALEKLNRILPTLEEKDIEKFVNLTLKLLDAQMAFDWSDRFAKTILKNPSVLKPIKGGTRTGTAQGNMAKLTKLNQGDGRTTPKKLLKDLPKDDLDSDVG